MNNTSGRNDDLSIARREFLKTSMLAGSGIFVASRLLTDGSEKALAATPQQSAPASTAGTVPVRLRVNGTNYGLRFDPRTSLLDLLREKLDLPGTKKGCNHGQCGACTILVDGRRINSCLALAVIYDGSEITTIEGLAKGDELHPLQSAFVRHEGFQCGYCTPGQICSAVAMLQRGGPGRRESRNRGRATSQDASRSATTRSASACRATSAAAALTRESSPQYAK